MVLPPFERNLTIVKKGFLQRNYGCLALIMVLETVDESGVGSWAVDRVVVTREESKLREVSR